ncbi:MAG: BA14K family protein [Pseudolabrys sp.]
MRKTTLAISTAIALACGAVSAPSTANAGCYGCAVGAGVAAGVIGGAIIGSAIANSRPYYYARGPYYAGPPRYYAPPPSDAVAYCMHRFRSYDPRSGTYLGYDGYRHPCP